MNDPLAPLLADGVIDAVVGRLKTGKEAEVWLVRSGGEIVAAKVYKARHARSFKNDAAYREGRAVRNTRTQRAMDRGSRFGRAAAEDAWKAKEADALFRLHALGLRVPRPVLFHEGVLLMEVVVDAGGHPAPRLVDARLSREHAADLYAILRRQVIGMLAGGLIHADLSPYNVLAGWDGPVVIDFPQVVDAAQNSQAERFFLRDLENVWRFCSGLDPALRAAAGDGREIWRAFVRRELTADFVPTGRAHEPEHARPQGDAGSHSGRPPHAPPHPRGGPPRGLGGSRGPGGQRRPDPRARAPGPEVVRVQRPPGAAGPPHAVPQPAPRHAQGGPHAGPHGQPGSHRHRGRHRRGR